MPIRAQKAGNRATASGRGHAIAMLAAAVLGGARPTPAAEPPSRQASLIASGGAASTGATHAARMAVGQSWTLPAILAGRGHNLRPGFLQAFVHDPRANTDGDGMPDEDDPDDDGDALSDLAELLGETFDPATPTDPLRADSDGDGAGDGSESRAGTNPLDRDSLLAITAVQVATNRATVAWQSRGGATYEVLAANTVTALTNGARRVATVHAQGGEPPWFGTTSEIVHESGTSVFYRVTRTTP